MEKQNHSKKGERNKLRDRTSTEVQDKKNKPTKLRVKLPNTQMKKKTQNIYLNSVSKLLHRLATMLPSNY